MAVEKVIWQKEQEVQDINKSGDAATSHGDFYISGANLIVDGNARYQDTSDMGVSDADIASKKYVDDNAGGTPEGTAILSTGEGGAVKFLREDGDDSCSWQVPAGSGDVSKVGTPINDEVGVWTGDGTLQGDAALTFDGSDLLISGSSFLTISQATLHINNISGATIVNAADILEVSAATLLNITEAAAISAATLLNTTHRGSDGSDHTFIDQDVTITGTPTFGVTTLGDSSQLASNAAPTADADLANKKYVDDNAGGAAVEPLWISGATLYPARTDHTISSANIISISGATLLNTTHRGSDGSDHSKVSANETAIALNTTHRSSDGTDHANVVSNASEIVEISGATLLNTTHRNSDGSGHANVATNTTHISSDGSDHSKVTANETEVAAVSAASLLNTSHRGSSGSDHSDVVSNTTHRSSDGSDHSKVGANETAIGLNTTHRNDNTQAHSDYLKNDAADVGVSLTLTADQTASAANYVPMAVFDTFATPLAASNYPKGTIYFQYTA